MQNPRSRREQNQGWGEKPRVSQMDRERGKDEAQKSTEVRPQGQEAVVNF